MRTYMKKKRIFAKEKLSTFQFIMLIKGLMYI